MDKKRLTRNLPEAIRAPAFGCSCTAAPLDPFPVDQCNLAPGIMQIPPCGFAGYPQSLCRLFLFKSFEVDKPDQLDLISLERCYFFDPVWARLNFVCPEIRS